MNEKVTALLEQIVKALTFDPNTSQVKNRGVSEAWEALQAELKPAEPAPAPEQPV